MLFSVKTKAGLSFNPPKDTIPFAHSSVSFWIYYGHVNLLIRIRCLKLASPVECEQ